MQNIEKNLRYLETHEWAKKEGSNIIVVGITDYAQSSLGDIVYIDLNSISPTVQKNMAVSTIESVKTATDIYSPVSGKVIAVNNALESNPGLINLQPYDEGWLFKVEVQDIEQAWSELLSPEAYHKQLAG